MKIDKPRRVERTYTQRLVAEPSRVFPLLCPVREREWITGWEPLMVLSRSGKAEADCIFITESFPNNSIWYVIRHDPEAGALEMIKVTPDVTACRLSIDLVPAEGGSEATITYMHTSLGRDGDAYVESFTEEFYRQFMEDWESRMNHYLTTGEALHTADS